MTQTPKYGYQLPFFAVNGRKGKIRSSDPIEVSQQVGMEKTPKLLPLL
jgi:hypothetical protein